MDAEFLALLVCPVCKGKLEYRAGRRELVCRAEKLVFPITEDGVPVLLAEEAKPLPKDDK